MKVIYIGGIGRSGSTLLERMLGSLPGTCALGEVKSIWKRAKSRDERCGCDTAVVDCDLWRAVGEKAFGGWENLDLRAVRADQRALERIRNIPWLARTRLTPDRLDAITGHVDLYRRVYAAAAEVTGSDVIIDSSKSPGLAFCLRWAPNLDLHFVHLVRDPRGVAHSFTKRVPRLEANWVDTMPRRKPRVTAVNWMTHNLAMSTLSPRSRDHTNAVQRIRYEDMLASPSRTVGRIADAAALGVAPADLTYLDGKAVTLGMIHSVAGNPMRYQDGPVRLRADDAWRTKLAPHHRLQVTSICAPLLAAYGYLAAPTRQRPEPK